MELATDYNPKNPSEIVTKPILDEGIIIWAGDKYRVRKHIWPVQLLPGELFLQVSEKEGDIKMARYHKTRCRYQRPSGEWEDLYFNTLYEAFSWFDVANVNELAKYCQVYVVVNTLALAGTVKYELYWYGNAWVVGEMASPIVLMMLVDMLPSMCMGSN
jgi:hypothetical protein